MRYLLVVAALMLPSCRSKDTYTVRWPDFSNETSPIWGCVLDPEDKKTLLCIDFATAAGMVMEANTQAEPSDHKL